MRRKQPMNPPQRQQGVALIMVLLVVALVAVVAVQLSQRLQMNVLRTMNYQQSEQAYWYWLSAEEIARQLLQQQVQDSDGVIHQEQVWYQQTQEERVYPIEGGGLVRAGIHDLQGCFNLNALKAEQISVEEFWRRKTQFRMLIAAAIPDLDQYQLDTIVESTADWLDEDEQMNTGYGAERADYESLPMPYQAANDFFVHESELRLVRNVTQPVYQALKPLVCVIPNSDKLEVNINTLTVEQGPLLHALMLGAITPDAAVQAIEQRPDDGYDNVDDAKRNSILAQASGQQVRPNLGGVPLPQGITTESLGGMFDDLVVKSNYFQLDTHVKYDEMMLRGQSKLYVSSDETVVLMRGVGEP